MVPTMPSNSPWWVWLVAVVVIVGIPALSGMVVAAIQRPMRQAVRAVATDAAVTREHTENAHADAEYPNLRDELTAVRELIAETRKDIGGIRSELRGARTDISEVRTWAQEAATDARKAAVDLAEHERDVADITAWARREMTRTT